MFHSYSGLVHHFVREIASFQSPANYSYHEPELESTFAYAEGHSTNADRPNVVCMLPSNFPLFSGLHSSTAATSKRAASGGGGASSLSSKTLDHASHVLEILQWTKSASRQPQQQPRTHHVWLFGEWTEAGPLLSSTLGPEFRVRSITSIDIDRPITQEIDWISFLTILRKDVPIQDSLAVFFDWPHAAMNEVERQQFMMLQLVMLYLLKPDHALIHMQLASEQNKDLKYPKGKIVLPMTDGPVIEHCLLWTTNEEYTKTYERYPASKLRDQFLYFVRETLEKVKYQDSMNGAVIPYLVKRQQAIVALTKSALAGLPSAPVLQVAIRDVEFGTNQGYVAISRRRVFGEEEVEEISDGLVFMMQVL